LPLYSYFHKEFHGWLYWVAVGLVIVSERLILYLWIVEAALGKNYSGFSLRLDRSALKKA
jgi:hypothetical protein